MVDSPNVLKGVHGIMVPKKSFHAKVVHRHISQLEKNKDKLNLFLFMIDLKRFNDGMDTKKSFTKSHLQKVIYEKSFTESYLQKVIFRWQSICT